MRAPPRTAHRSSSSAPDSYRGSGQAARCSSTSPRASPSSRGMPWNGCRQYQVTTTLTGAAALRSRLARKAVFSQVRYGQGGGAISLGSIPQEPRLCASAALHADRRGAWSGCSLLRWLRPHPLVTEMARPGAAAQICAVPVHFARHGGRGRRRRDSQGPSLSVSRHAARPAVARRPGGALPPALLCRQARAIHTVRQWA